MSLITTIPAHTFEPCKRATDNGLVDDPACGYMHKIDDDTTPDLRHNEEPTR